MGGGMNSFTFKHICTLSLALASRVMPQSLHETGNQKRGLAHGGRKRHNLFSPSFPSLFLLLSQVLAGRVNRGWDCLPFPLEALLSVSLPPFLCHTLSPSISPSLPTLHAAAGVLSSSLSPLVLVFSLSIHSSLCSVNLPLASLMSGLPGCLLHGSRLCAFQALWQCFSQAPLVPPHTTNSHAAQRRMREGEEWRRGLQRRVKRQGEGGGGCIGWD